MTKKVQLADGFECSLTVKGEGIDLGNSLHETISERFAQECLSHKYHPTTALITVSRENQTDKHNLVMNMHVHLNAADYHARAYGKDPYLMLSDAMHHLNYNITKHK